MRVGMATIRQTEQDCLPAPEQMLQKRQGCSLIFFNLPA